MAKIDSLEKISSGIPHLEPEMFIGMSYGDARKFLEGAGYNVRTTAHGKPHWRELRDYDPLTMNLRVTNNLVVDAYKG
jgi:hypothetical protein